MRYKIVYHVGPELTVKTKVASGTLTFQDDALRISGPSEPAIPFAEIRHAEMFRLHGLGRMIKMVCDERTIFLTAVRFNLGGYFVLINAFRTGQVYEQIAKRVRKIQAQTATDARGH